MQRRTTISNTGMRPSKILMHSAPTLEQNDATAMHASPEFQISLQRATCVSMHAYSQLCRLQHRPLRRGAQMRVCSQERFLPHGSRCRCRTGDILVFTGPIAQLLTYQRLLIRVLRMLIGRSVAIFMHTAHAKLKLNPRTRVQAGSRRQTLLFGKLLQFWFSWHK